jgi:hypothetical protein
MRRLVTAALATALLSATPARAAQPPASTAAFGSKALVGWAILGWNDSAGLGGSFQTSLVPQGLIHDPGFKVRESLDLDLGVDYLHYWNSFYAGPNRYDVSELNLHAGVVWNFWLTPQLALYPKVALGYGFAHYSGNWNSAYGHGDHGGLYPELAIGGQLRLANAVSLRSELGWAGLKIGLGVTF